ncbi:glyoxylate reductase [Verticillium alfalfae VaMs.102]|uniref:Glyoxylate reductase n=1 Tax=Verticillium alfalfae (strain VaMs.102 / ATCC MYA-4576 / FGSC 10136) TaxID=526221 RepID=C9S9P8_VERA1|nr:glyoxylate reductase [Verticillium alfalfae VaMs.102]EEY16111.1 glyoxylate reductase [Verticillium alfalfae VaMs.102]
MTRRKADATTKPFAMPGNKPTILRLGENIKYNPDYYRDTFTQLFDVVANEEPDRASFIAALKSKKYGNFSAIFRPHFQSGGEMGQWDDELISYLPRSRAARTCDPEQFMAMHRLVGSISWNPRDHVLGIVGLGNISKKVALKARKALGMKIHYFDVCRSPPEVEQELQATYHSTLHELLRVSDCVTLHVPLNAHTRDLIDGDAIAAMKDGARLINTARGEVVHEQALIAALKSGKLSAAALDVHYHEPQVSPVLAEMENVTLTCHNGGAAITTRLNFELGAMKNIVEVVGTDGEFIGEPLTPVNRKAFEAS